MERQQGEGDQWSSVGSPLFSPKLSSRVRTGVCVLTLPRCTLQDGGADIPRETKSQAERTGRRRTQALKKKSTRAKNILEKEELLDQMRDEFKISIKYFQGIKEDIINMK